MLKTGKVLIGSNKVLKNLKLGKTKGIVVAQNSPKNIMDDITYYSQFNKIPIITFPNNSLELGSICGRPHSVCSIGILNAGQSKILSAQKESIK